MGILVVQVGEFLSRMSRVAGLKGRVRPALDDTMVPVVQVYDATRAPYRLDEQKYFQARYTANTNAGDGSTLAILNKSAGPVIVESWRLVNRTPAAVRVTINVSVRSLIDSLAGQVDASFATYELAGAQGAGGTSLVGVRNDVVLRDGRSVGAFFPQTGFFIDQVDMPSSAAGESHVESPDRLDLLLPAGTGLVFVPQILNHSIGLSAQIRIPNAVVGS